MARAMTTLSEPAVPPKKPEQVILQQQIEEELEQLQRPFSGLLLSGIAAGFELGFSVFFMGAMLTLVGDQLSEAVRKLLVANVYTIGYIFVILGRSELFTEHTTQAVLPVLNRQASLRSLARLWVIVYVANLIGGAVFSSIASLIGPAMGAIEPAAFAEIAQPLVGHSWWVILLGGVLAGWMMGLLTWLVTAGRDTISQVFCVWVVTFAIGFTHLPHSIAGTVEILTAILAGQAVGWGELGHFLLWATAGNALGGAVFVAILKYAQVNQRIESRK
jgi:formate-nitrite transporter family protein